MALIVTLALGAGVLAQRADRALEVNLENPAIQVAIEPQPAPPQPAAPVPPQPAPKPPPKPRVPVREPHRQPASAPPLMAEVAAIPAADPAVDPGPPSVPAESAAPPRISSGSIEAQYAATLRSNIDARTSLPTSAEYRLLKPQGVAQVSFTLDRAGSVLGTEIAKGSGSRILDRQAVGIVQTGRYPAFPEAAFRGESRHTFIVTIEFHL
ncbi:MAG TPA: TonB family protein [Steroidobacteraceae bacterium]|nr:TonB family protein [Steroidobacteraceae bacterium]